jgi:hypothetical protein
MRAEAPEPSIRGSYISPSKAWIQRIYGEDVWEKAVAVLPAEEQALYRSELVGVAWYPLRQWTAILGAVRDHALVAKGEDGKTFDRRHLYESISGTMQTVYRIAFALMSATTVVAKVTPLFKRVYSHGEYQVIENTPGQCLIRFSEAPVEMLPEVERSFPLATSWMLDVAGQKVTGVRLASKSTGRYFSSDLRLEYQPKK